MVLREAGFTLRGRTSFEVTHRWTASSLAGFVWSTSILPRPAFGERAGEFQAELAERLAPYPLTATVGFAFDLASRGPGRAGTR